ncbi:MAG: DUF6057 family protein [Paludibacteraceae bacterium]|nr:DUF6057 family protein [Paludibacteraceae bacterium]
MENKKLLFIPLLVFLETLGVLVVHESDLLFTMQNYSYYSSDECFTLLAVEEGGQISLITRYLLQFFYHPKIAAIALSLVLTLTGYASAKLSKAEGYFSILHYIPQSLFVAAIALVDIQSISFVTIPIFSAIIAYMLTIWSLVIARAKSQDAPIIGANIAFAASILMIWACGIYGLLPILCFAATDAATKQNKNISYVLAAIVVAIFLINVLGNNLRALSPMPDTFFSLHFTIIVLAFVFMIVCLATSTIIKTLNKERIVFIAGMILFLSINLVAAFISDNNFHTQCSINRDLESYDFKKIIERVDELESPTEANIAYRTIALDQTGKLTKNLFQITPNRASGIDPYRRHLADFCLYSGSSNDALLHAMNNHLSLGYSFSNIKTMAIAYLLNGEIESAKKMIKLLSQGIFYKDWAEQVSAAMKDPEVFFKKFPQYQKTKKGSFKNVVFINESDNIFEMYDRTIPQSPVHFERLLLSKLYLRDIDAFSEWMLRMASLGVKDYQKAMPECFQEAACLCALKGNPVIINNFPVTPQIRERVQKFAKLKQDGNSEEEIAKKMGRSYLTYFFFAPIE